MFHKLLNIKHVLYILFIVYCKKKKYLFFCEILYNILQEKTHFSQMFWLICLISSDLCRSEVCRSMYDLLYCLCASLPFPAHFLNPFLPYTLPSFPPLSASLTWELHHHRRTGPILVVKAINHFSSHLSLLMNDQLFVIYYAEKRWPAETDQPLFSSSSSTGWRDAGQRWWIASLNCYYTYNVALRSDSSLGRVFPGLSR